MLFWCYKRLLTNKTCSLLNSCTSRFLVDWRSPTKEEIRRYSKDNDHYFHCSSQALLVVIRRNTTLDWQVISLTRVNCCTFNEATAEYFILTSYFCWYNIPVAHIHLPICKYSALPLHQVGLLTFHHLPETSQTQQMFLHSAQLCYVHSSFLHLGLEYAKLTPHPEKRNVLRTYHFPPCSELHVS